MGLYTVGSTGMRPIGGVIVGYVGQHVGPRAALAFGGFSVALALGLWWAIGRTASRAAPVDTRNGARSDPGAVSSPAAQFPRARPGQRDRGEPARLLLGVVGLEVLVVPGVVDEDRQHVVAAGLRDT